MRAFTPIIAAASLLAACAATAEGIYLEFTPGITVSPDQPITGGAGGAELTSDVGWNLGGAVGYRFEKYFRLEGNLSYRGVDLDQLEGFGPSRGVRGDGGAFAVLGNGYFELVQEGPVRPYVGFGLGIATVNLDASVPRGAFDVDDASTEFAYNVLTGLSVAVSDQIELNLGYRYFATTDPTYRAIVNNAPRIIQTEFDSHEFLFGIRYNFESSP